uniref:Cytochrome c oxidase assembly factor 3 n=1 Tax=Strongyloides papillosus TaxID=174720 RepID=A0A0N5BHY3_STREA
MTTTLIKLMKLPLKQRMLPLRGYSLSIKEPSKTIAIDKSRQAELDAKYDPNSEYLQKVNIEDLPRAQQKFAKQFEKVNEERVKEIFKRNYKNIIGFVLIASLVVGIYSYTIYAVKQETFLEEIDLEVAQEKGTGNQMALETKKGH